MINKPKILIVGGAGYIGGYMTDILRSATNVTVYDNLMYETRYLKDVDFIRGDCRDFKKLKSIINYFDVVIWLAAVVGDGACAANPFIAKDVNENTVRWLSENFKGKIIFTSTCSVYGANNQLIDEETGPNPLSVYAETKLAAEKWIQSNSDNFVIFRLGTLFGMGDDHSRIRLDLVVNILTLKAIQKKPLTVFGGNQWRPLLHVRDVTGAVLHVLEHDIKGLYNLSQCNLTIKDIALEIQSLIPCTIEYSDIPFEDQRNYRVSNQKIVDTGWEPDYNLKIGIGVIGNTILENRIVNVDDPIYHNASYLKDKYGY